ncbi:pyridoxal-dependent decarboxylase [Magnetospirillum sp. XM-1]|uniref:pyridoxal phosphate-dependent decarboxylase family protein n=1 Tax=Magnetospirillum sp. XM-1 TaxID=1663591 RepID=UPI0008386C15|nr:pyridoxal-dependent decarboxylase [Magnetospirillum sp. XM-1]
MADALDSGLDPADWEGLRAQAHRMLDESLDFIRDVRRHPVWRPMPAEVRAAFDAPPPRMGQELAAIDSEFRQLVEPFGPGNVHPGFMGWVHGGGTVEGMLAEMMAGGLNANLGGRDHAPMEVERQILRWMRNLFGYPEGASGLFVTGTSMANFLALLVARTRALGTGIRRTGLSGAEGLVAYASAAAHGCIPQAFEMSGLGAASLRLLPTDSAHRLDMEALRQAVAADRAAGRRPFMVVGSAGTVDVGAIDDLGALATFAEAEGMWFHVDGAFGALGMMSPELAPLLAGIERSDSIAFDFHKWGQVPYDAGYLLVRDGEAHRAAFASPAAYLRRETRGLAAGSPWPCDYGPDLSRGFRALKTWITLKAHGMDALGAAMARCCEVARHLAARIQAEPSLELLAPVALNIVCFHRPGADCAQIVADLHESGIAAPSTTTIDGKLAIRAAIVNHRTRKNDVDRMVDEVLRVSTK